jgi:hypothetical protein
MNQSPLKPWVPGQQPGYTAYQITVTVCEDDLGQVWSEHSFASDVDAQACASTKGGGVEQVAHALLTEGLRREVFVDALLTLSKSPYVLHRWKTDPGAREQIVARLQSQVTEVLHKKLPLALPGLIAGVLEMMSAQEVDPKGSPEV